MADSRAARSELHHLPPHLREVCQILARGLVRLRRRSTEELARDAAGAWGAGDVPLHSLGGQSVHADPLGRAEAE
jgi:hypothetical protein